MNDEAKVLFDMFPDTPHQTLANIWRNCGEDFSTALDEALTVASLGNAQEQARFDGAGFAAIEAPVDYWEDAPALLPALGERGFVPETIAGPVSSSRAHDTAPETRRPSANGGGVTPNYADAASAMSPGEIGLPRLPWEGKEKRYVIGSGELGLLNELQMPRRGAVVPLPEDFLRVPVGSSQPATPPATAAEPLIVLDPDGGSSEPNCVPSPTLASVRGSAVWDDESRRGDPASSSPGASFGGRQFRSPAKNKPPVKASPTLLRNVGESQATAESADAKPQMKVVGGDRNDGVRVGDSPGKEAWANRSSGQRKKSVPTALRGEPTPASRKGNSRPPARGGSAWGAGTGSTALKVETASAAERIASFRPGTRFRVAVDKGVTGLGITVKEIRGRFFVYKLQSLADGSQGAAEEAGVLAGDQLLGVEELDFETERWDMDQLVSYMGELMGVVILHVMRGFGPLPQAPKSDFENGMSYGVARANEEDGAVDGSAGTDGGNERGVSTVQRRARRLVEVLEEEDLSKPSEAADISRLYCQISDRARQWDTGELWLSVNDMARRPSRDTLAVIANQWHPDPPPGWDESDSSEGRSLPNSSGAQRTERSSSDISDDSLAPDPAATKRDGFSAQDGDETGTDLDTIGAALLGQPLFSDPLMEGRVDGAAAAAAAAPRSSVTDDDGEGGGHYWSPWPQLVALESKAAQRTTVVPTQGLRKALNVRILEQPPPVPPAAAGSDDGKGGRSSAPQTVSYLVWVMDVESGAEWKVRRCHPEFSELWEVCTGMRPSLARLDFPPWLPDVKETPGVVEARRPRLEAYLQRLCSLLYMGPLHPSSAHLAHLLQDFLGTSPRVETLGRLQRSRPERELRQALQVRAWQVFRLPPLERAVADFVREICDSPASRSKKAVPAEAVLKRLTDVIEHLQYVVTEGCFNELREMVRSSSAVTASAGRGHSSGRGSEGGEGGGNDHPELASLAEEDEALDLISGSVRRQVEAEVFVPVMGRLYQKLRTEGATARLEKAVVLGVEEARGKPQTYHGVPTSNISPSGWSSSMRLLQTVGLFTLPCDKLDALMAVAHDIPALHRVEHPGDNASSLGADDFLPIFIYVLVNSRVENLAAQSVILETLCDPKKMMGEAGFCVATFSAALQHLSRQAEERSRSRTFSSFLGRR